MSPYRIRSVRSKTKAQYSPKRIRRPRQEALEVASSHPMPMEVQLTMPLPEFMDNLRIFLFGNINNTIVDASRSSSKPAIARWLARSTRATHPLVQSTGMHRYPGRSTSRTPRSRCSDFDFFHVRRTAKSLSPVTRSCVRKVISVITCVRWCCKASARGGIRRCCRA